MLTLAPSDVNAACNATIVRMRKEGTIIRWEAERGFGFIRAPGGSADAFLHVKECRSLGGQVPREGLRVTFEEVHVGRKGQRAVAVQLAGPRAPVQPGAARTSVPPACTKRNEPSAPAPSSGAWLVLPLMLAYAAVLAWAVWQRTLPWWVLPASFMVNALTFFAYWQDKFAAERKRWRIAEDTLHLWALAGGWGGAWFAQQVLRHKSRKASFREGYALTVLAHCGALGAWLRTVRGG
jgi:uncharacterized membrane protein YsdA (DUF1294 family)/cold shock CspA family protein